MTTFAEACDGIMNNTITEKPLKRIYEVTIRNTGASAAKIKIRKLNQKK